MSIFGSEYWSIIVTLSVLAGTVIFFTTGKVRSDIVAFCAVLSLMLFGVLTPQEALSGFSNTIIMTIAGVFVIGGAIVRSGLANAISNKILKLAGESQNALFMLVMLITAIIGSLVSNTGTVAIMMPIVVSMATSINVSPSRFLMPLAFMSGIGGMLTLIGNPGNMVVNDVYVKAGYTSLTLFSFLPLGIVCLIFGMLILAPATSYFLARRKNDKGEAKDKGVTLKDLADKYQLAQNVCTLLVPPHSPAAGQNLLSLNLTGNYGVVLQEIRRPPEKHSHFGSHRARQISPGPQTTIQTGDTLYGIGSPENIQKLAEALQLNLIYTPSKGKNTDVYHFESIGICELVLMSSSHLVHRTVQESSLREQFGVTLLGIQRGDQYILDNLKEQAMQSGDALLVQGTWDSIAHLDEHAQNWVVVGRPQDQMAAPVQDKAPYVAFVLCLMILSMALGLLPTVASVMLAALLMLVGRCYRNVEEAYSAINWETIVMISCMLPMAIAMEKTGLVHVAAECITDLGLQYGPLMALALVYGITSGLNIIISATPVALLVAPVALQTAVVLSVSPLPFIYAVAAASCLCFASPFSTPSNALVMSAGRYTFFDYLKIGLPLQILLGIVLVFVLPLLFPF